MSWSVADPDRLDAPRGSVSRLCKASYSGTDPPSAGVGGRPTGLRTHDLRLCRRWTPGYTIALFQSNESFGYCEPSIQRTKCSRWRQR